MVWQSFTWKRTFKKLLPFQFSEFIALFINKGFVSLAVVKWISYKTQQYNIFKTVQCLSKVLKTKSNIVDLKKQIQT